MTTTTFTTGVQSFETFLRASRHPALDPVTQEGVWRRLTVRTSRNCDCLLAVYLNSTKLSAEELNELKQDLERYCAADGRRVGVTGLYCSYGRLRENGACDDHEHVWGNRHITETVLGKKFRISLQSFFRVNTGVVEKLCETVAELSELNTSDVLVDICSGLGTIGISLWNRALKVFCLELGEKGHEDAMHNTQLNAASNVEPILGNCQATLPAVFEATRGLPVKAVVDPSRAGLRSCKVASLIECLRAQEEVSTVVYIISDGDKSPQNFQSFVKPAKKFITGQIFVPVRAVVLDLIPLTEKFELAIVWERYDEVKWQQIMNGAPLPRDEAYFQRAPDPLPALECVTLLQEELKTKAQAPSANRRRKDRFKSGPNYHKKPQQRRSPSSQIPSQRASSETRKSCPSDCGRASGSWNENRNSKEPGFSEGSWGEYRDYQGGLGEPGYHQEARGRVGFSGASYGEDLSCGSSRGEKGGCGEKSSLLWRTPALAHAYSLSGGFDGVRRGGFGDRSSGEYGDRSSGGYDNRGSSGYDVRGSSGYGGTGRGGYNCKVDGGYGDRGSSGYNGKVNGGYSGRGSGGYSDRGSGGYGDRGSGGYGGRGSGGYGGRGSGEYGGRGSGGYGGRGNCGYGDKGSDGYGGYQEMY